MLHLIKRINKKFDVVSVGENGEMLSETRQGFEKRAEAIKNIRAQLTSFWAISTYFQDDTGLEILVYSIQRDKSVRPIEADYVKAQPKYIPGKNPRKKKN